MTISAFNTNVSIFVAEASFAIALPVAASAIITALAIFVFKIFKVFPLDYRYIKSRILVLGDVNDHLIPYLTYHKTLPV
jgi:hypothetical protein